MGNNFWDNKTKEKKTKLKPVGLIFLLCTVAAITVYGYTTRAQKSLNNYNRTPVDQSKMFSNQIDKPEKNKDDSEVNQIIGTENSSNTSKTEYKNVDATRSNNELSNNSPGYEPYKYTETPADKYDEWKIRQAEEEARQAAEERKKHDEACRPILEIRQQLLAPLNAQFDEITRQMNQFEAETNARTDINQAQKDRILAVELPKFHDQLFEVSEQIEQVNATYPACTLYNF